ncbi:hypothetical protein F5Y19DRAFT_57681 [Xylariaceae sp. FL1651]|nr:hypothetical protein F5Y19DRAFT_57681 [Xylariaceae sp. FL1651]
MPTMRFSIPKLGFLKKLLSKRPNAETTSESTGDVVFCKQKDEKISHSEPPPEECPICHDPVGIANPEGIVESWIHLHCGHKFGTHCIQTWLQESAERDPHSVPSCPICRSSAKHPCGHPVIMPAPRPSPFPIWATPIPPPSPHPQNRRVRRRLSRRVGHPLRPILQRPDRPHVQTVGECNTCAATAALEKSMRQTTTPGVDTAGSTSSRRGRNSERRAGIKSMLLPPSFRRSSNANSDSNEPEGLTTLINISSEHPTTIVRVPISHPEFQILCRVQPGDRIPRIPTPTPALNRRLSF